MTVALRTYERREERDVKAGEYVGEGGLIERGEKQDGEIENKRWRERRGGEGGQGSSFLVDGWRKRTSEMCRSPTVDQMTRSGEYHHSAGICSPQSKHIASVTPLNLLHNTNSHIERAARIIQEVHGYTYQLSHTIRKVSLQDVLLILK